MHERDLADRRVHRATDDWEDGPPLVLRVAKFGRRGSWVLRLFRLRTNVELRLDDLSRTAWLAFDGRTVAEVLAELQAAFPEEPGLPERLGAFVSMLADRDLVRLE